MMRVNELFYAQADPPAFMNQNSAQQIIRDPRLFTDSLPAKPKSDPPVENKNKPVVMRVSICCSSCVDVIEHDINKVKGVKTIECDVHRGKVTVTGTATVPDLLTAARRKFKNAKLWE